MQESKLMKDGLGPAAIKRIAASLSQVHNDFDSLTFIRSASKAVQPLELRDRVNAIIEILHHHLPSNFSKTAKILLALPKVWDRGDENDPIRGFAIWPIIDYCAVYGLHSPSTSLKVLEKLTPLFSAEFAIRAFVEQHPEKTFKFIHKWCSHPCEHVRRLASEGIRPRLPWGKQLKGYINDPTPIIPILESLKNDPSLYVRRSVANCLNDISKDHPTLIITTLSHWKKENTPEINWMTQHALRTLIKSGHPTVFPLLGYSAKPKIKVSQLALAQDKLSLGNEQLIHLTLKSLQEQKLVLDYAVYFVKASGEVKSKVFKWKALDLKKNQIIKLEKKHSFKRISTRKLYRGQHSIAIHVNGVEYARDHFFLET